MARLQIAGLSASSALPENEVKKKGIPIDALWAIAAGVLILVGFGVAVGIQEWIDPKPIKLHPNVTIFALLYVTAQALERLMEPLAAVFLTTKEETKTVEAKKTEAERAQAVGNVVAASEALQEGANAQEKKDMKRTGRTFFFWAVGSTLAFLASAGLGLYLVQMISVENPPARWFDLLITGLAIGGGTKPLHDLITRIEKAKTTAEEGAAANP